MTQGETYILLLGNIETTVKVKRIRKKAVVLVNTTLEKCSGTWLPIKAIAKKGQKLTLKSWFMDGMKISTYMKLRGEIK